MQQIPAAAIDERKMDAMCRISLVRLAFVMAVVCSVSAASLATPAAAQESRDEGPPIQLADDLFDSTNPKTLGLTMVPGKHTLLYQATKDSYKFCHHPNLTVFRNRLYCMWSNGKVDEDAPGQRVLYSWSENGETWTKPTLLVDADAGRGICVATGFLADDKQLVAYYTQTGGTNFHPATRLLAITTSDGLSWSSPRQIASGFFIESPRRVDKRRLLLAGEHVGDARTKKRMQILYTDDPGGLTDWTSARIQPTNLRTFGYTEPSFFQRTDEKSVCVFRNYSGFLYASVSSDRGDSWTTPAPTRFPDSTARISAGNLPDGTAYLINNATPKQFDRSLLTIALSRDGIRFDRAMLVRGEPTKGRFDGKHKLDGWQYPHAVVWNEALFVAYSINKEDVGITRIPLTALTNSPK